MVETIVKDNQIKMIKHDCDKKTLIIIQTIQHYQLKDDIDE